MSSGEIREGIFLLYRKFYTIKNTFVFSVSENLYFSQKSDKINTCTEKENIVH